MPKTAQFIEESKSVDEPSREPTKRKMHPNSLKNLVAPWKRGDVPNPKGKNQHDEAAAIARAVISNNADEIYKAMSSGILKGNFYGFDVIANRAYGKLKESKEVTHFHGDTPDSELGERIAQLERDLGLAGAIDEAGRVGIAQARAAETVTEPQDK